MNLRMRELIYAFYLTSNAKELVGMKVKYVQENSSLSFFFVRLPEHLRIRSLVFGSSDYSSRWSCSVI